MEFKRILANWYTENARDLPWRKTNDPYKIWIAEIILQQTRVAQGLGYYLRFINEFPTVFDLASADEDKVLKVWQGLGYYTRARNLQKGAKRIVDEFDGFLPSTYSELLTIPGIGPYSAGAIASFAFKQPTPAIDGNVYRVIARIYGIFSSPFDAKGKKDFFNLVTELIDVKNPDSFNQALLDFGAIQCTPNSPNCTFCPFIEYCYAYRNNLIASLPVKAPKSPPRSRFFTYILIKHEEYTLISKREGKDIWHSLYEFPLFETTHYLDESDLLSHPDWKKMFRGINPTIINISQVVKHQLSHQTLHAQFVIVKVDRLSRPLTKRYKLVKTNQLDNYSTPVLIDTYLAAEPAAKYFLNEPTD